MNEASMDRPDGVAWPNGPATAVDVRNCYRLFLAREAENGEVVRHKVGMAIGPVMAAFVSSEEIAAKLGPVEDGALLTVELALIDRVEDELAAWFAGHVPLSGEMQARIGRGVSRLELIGLILSREELAGDLRVLEQRGDPPAEAYADAIGQAFETAARLRQSPLFDESYYRRLLGPGEDPVDPALHYVLVGERQRLRPSERFDPMGYQLNHADLQSYRGSLLLHYEEHGRDEGRSFSAPTREDVRDDQADIIRHSQFFDEAFYRAQLGDEAASIGDLARHYLATGEKAGLQPSPRFDPAAYADLHADIAASDINRLLHFEVSGRQEGRAHRSPVDHFDYSTDGIDPEKPTVLLLLHEATHTGAPILGWNLARKLQENCNIVFVLGNGGTLEPALRSTGAAVIGPLTREALHDARQMSRLAKRLVGTYRPLYVIANSYEARFTALALREEGVPIVALIHEFVVGGLPGTRSPYYSRCAAIVFPAEIVRESSFHAFREIGYQTTAILPQGPSAVPSFDDGTPTQRRTQALFRRPDGEVELEQLLASSKRGEEPFTILGLGTISQRKGIDLFMAAATALKHRHPDLEFRFIWIGNWDLALSGALGELGGLLQEQLRRSDLDRHLFFFPAVDDLEPAYARADALFLSSRLDPLPNITIDAAMRDIPVVCFDRASGFAELLLADPETADLVVPHLDSGAAADRIAALAGNPAARAVAAQAVGRIGRATFDMDAYARRIDSLGRAAAAKFAFAQREEEILSGSGLFDPGMYFEAAELRILPPGRTLVGEYLDRTRHLNFALPPVWAVGVKRPAPGFHPFIYGTEAPGFPADGRRDPLAHYAEQGCPPGRWMHQIIRPADGRSTPAAPAASPAVQSGLGRRLKSRLAELLGMAPPAIPATPVGPTRKALRVAMHGHFHYTDNIQEFMEGLAVNRTPIDLFLTTSSDESAAILTAATRDYTAGGVTIEVGANAGRDIGPFLRVMRKHLLGRYDVVGHLHGKRSLHTISYDKDLGNRWRHFLWQHLLGPEYPTADIILDRMAGYPNLGMVFPETDFMIGWEHNLESGPEMAARIGMKLPLPQFIEFPVGTMFWARCEALRKLVELDLKDEDYPPEPLPIDGTMLHAIERLLPLICEDAGYSYATTYIPHIKR